MCNEVVEKCLCSLIYVPHDYRTLEVYERVVVRNPYFLMLLPDCLNTFFLTHTKFTTTPITNIHCINHTVPGLLVHSDII